MKAYSVIGMARQDFSGDFPSDVPHFNGELILENETEFVFKTDSGVVLRFQRRHVYIVMEYGEKIDKCDD